MFELWIYYEEHAHPSLTKNQFLEIIRVLSQPKPTRRNILFLTLGAFAMKSTRRQIVVGLL